MPILGAFPPKGNFVSEQNRQGLNQGRVFAQQGFAQSKKCQIHIIDIDTCLFCEVSLTGALGVLHMPLWWMTPAKRQRKDCQEQLQQGIYIMQYIQNTNTHAILFGWCLDRTWLFSSQRYNISLLLYLNPKLNLKQPVPRTPGPGRIRSGMKSYKSDIMHTLRQTVKN